MKENFDIQEYADNRGFTHRHKYNCPVCLYDILTDVSEYVYQLLKRS